MEAGSAALRVDWPVYPRLTPSPREGIEDGLAEEDQRTPGRRHQRRLTSPRTPDDSGRCSRAERHSAVIAAYKPFEPQLGRHCALMMARWRNGAATAARGAVSASGAQRLGLQLKHELRRAEADPLVERDGRQQDRAAIDRLREHDVSVTVACEGRRSGA